MANKSIHHYLRCRVGDEWYGIEIGHVSKVLHFVALTELPDANPEMLGLMTLPGCVIPVIDLRRCFGDVETPLSLATPIVIIEISDGLVGLAIDDADNIEAVDSTVIHSYQHSDTAYVEGAARVADHLLLLLDLSQFDSVLFGVCLTNQYG